MRWLSLLVLLCACTPDDDDDSAPRDDDDATEARFDDDLAAALQAELENQHAMHEAPAMSWAVVDDQGALWEGFVGVEDLATGTAIDADAPYNIASISKTYTGALILLLVDDGVLSLDDTLEQHLAGVHPRGDEITVRHLLQQTAGVPEVTASTEFLADQTAAWTEEELVGFVADDPLLFDPGTDYSYSNSHYVLLGLIAGAAVGTPWREQLSERIFEPLGLEHTRAPGAEGWGDLLPSFVGPTEVSLFVHPLGIGAAGGLVSTARDGAVFAKARFGGGLLSAEMTAAQEEDAWLLTPAISSGLGVVVFDSGDERQLAHNGALNGFVGWIGHRPTTGFSVSMLANAWGAGTPPDFGYSGPVSDAMWGVIDGGR